MSNLASKNNKRISVVIGTYNGEDYIIEQIESILQQTLLPDELIIVDDASSDKTLNLIQSIDIERKYGIEILIIKQEKNQGYIKNFLTGIFNTSSKFVFLCDQDDIWLPNKLGNMVDLFEKNPQIIALHSNTSIVDEYGQILQERVQNYDKDLENINLHKLIKKVNYPGMALAFRRNKIVLKLEELVKSGVTIPTHDWTICYLACLEEGFYITQQVLTYRRYTGKNVALSLNDTKRKYDLESRIKGIKLYLTYYHFVKEYQDHIQQKKYFDINKNISSAEKRIDYLKKKSIPKWFLSVLQLNSYPSYKAFFMDFLVMIKDK